jgi:hypothetical protein
MHGLGKASTNTTTHYITFLNIFNGLLKICLNLIRLLDAGTWNVQAGTNSSKQATLVKRFPNLWENFRNNRKKIIEK